MPSAKLSWAAVMLTASLVDTVVLLSVLPPSGPTLVMATYKVRMTALVVVGGDEVKLRKHLSPFLKTKRLEYEEPGGLTKEMYFLLGSSPSLFPLLLILKTQSLYWQFLYSLG